MKTPKHVAVLLFDRVNAIDVAGPTEVFATALTEQGQAAYDVETWSFAGNVVRCESGLQLASDRSVATRRRADLLLVPGGEGLRAPGVLDQCAQWLRQHHHRFERVVSVCTGAYALCASGLLDGQSVTTHWDFADALQKQFPSVNVASDQLFVRSGKFYSSGGVTAGIDLGLEIVAQDLGPRAAMRVARELVVFMRRSGHQSQFSEPLRTQASAPARLDDALGWAMGRLHWSLSVEQLAERAGLSPRQFSRTFKRAYGTTPAVYIKRLKLDYARTLLAQGNTVTQVAEAVGFATDDGFRKAFLSVFGISPARYRIRFADEAI